MQYRSAKNDDLSILGYGCMRFTRKGRGIDIDKAEAEVLEAIKLGVNYFDTAWLYAGNEEVLGTILARNNCREDVLIATKLPQYLVRKTSDFDKFFEEECRRLKTDYVDYYLMHMLADRAQWEKLAELGVLEWLDNHVQSGRIRNVGFSFHGTSDTFCELLEAHDWDFCQIQYNYLDEHSQGGVVGLKRAHELGIPVIIMEPLRGGKLTNNLPQEALTAFQLSGHNWSPAEWGFRWLWNQPEVTCVLSGMNSMEMLQENVRVANEVEAGSFGPTEFAVIEVAREAIEASMKVGCTECRYCMPCPKGVDIPGIFSAYNRAFVDGKTDARFHYLQGCVMREDPGFATACVRCGKCESHCPQSLPIMDLLQQADKLLSPPPYKVGRSVVRAFTGAGRKKSNREKPSSNYVTSK